MAGYMMNFCINCHWCDYRPPNYRAKVKARYFCIHPQVQVVDIVSGKPITQSCQQVRDGKCGKQGELFVAKDVQQVFNGIFGWILKHK